MNCPLRFKPAPIGYGVVPLPAPFSPRPLAYLRSHCPRRAILFLPPPSHLCCRLPLLRVPRPHSACDACTACSTDVTIPRLARFIRPSWPFSAPWAPTLASLSLWLLLHEPSPTCHLSTASPRTCLRSPYTASPLDRLRPQSCQPPTTSKRQACRTAANQTYTADLAAQHWRLRHLVSCEAFSARLSRRRRQVL